MAAPPRCRLALHAALRRTVCRVSAAVAVPPRGRLAALHALWVASVLYIANAVARCARLGGGSLPDDDRCRISLEYSPAIVFVSLLGRSILRRREARKELGGDDGGVDAVPKKLSSSPEPQRPACDAEAGSLMIVAFAPSLGLTLFGLALLLVQPPDPAMAALGSIMANVGWLGVSITLCILDIPYAVLRLRKALSVKAGDTEMV